MVKKKIKNYDYALKSKINQVDFFANKKIKLIEMRKKYLIR